MSLVLRDSRAGRARRCPLRSPSPSGPIVAKGGREKGGARYQENSRDDGVPSAQERGELPDGGELGQEEEAESLRKQNNSLELYNTI